MPTTTEIIHSPDGLPCCLLRGGFDSVSISVPPDGNPEYRARFFDEFAYEEFPIYKIKVFAPSDYSVEAVPIKRKEVVGPVFDVADPGTGWVKWESQDNIDNSDAFAIFDLKFPSPENDGMGYTFYIERHHKWYVDMGDPRGFGRSGRHDRERRLHVRVIPRKPMSYDEWAEAEMQVAKFV